MNNEEIKNLRISLAVSKKFKDIIEIMANEKLISQSNIITSIVYQSTDFKKYLKKYEKLHEKKV